MTIVAATTVADASQNVSLRLVYARMSEKLHISHMFCFTLNYCQLPIAVADC
jgi:hypothetical protein